jgi:hypothetical protein
VNRKEKPKGSFGPAYAKKKKCRIRLALEAQGC